MLHLLLQGHRGAKKLKRGSLYLYVGNGVRAEVEAIESFGLVLPNGLIIVLDNCHYAPSITMGVVSVSCLVDNGFTQCFTDFGLSVSMNNLLYFNAITVNGIYEIDMRDSTLPIVNSMYSISNKRTKSNLDSTYLWHCRLAHINKKRIEKLQHDGVLKSTDNEPFDQYGSCISGKMTRKPFSHKTEKVKDVIGLIHTDVCGPLRHVSKKGASYFITFTDDYSRYGYVYLLKHKHEVFETFKVFKSEVENQLEKTIKAIRSNRGGKYISQEFKDYLKTCGIVQKLTPPYTPQHNGKSERRNRTLLNMVRSMMSLTILPLSFWDYALESATRILNMVPTKKISWKRISYFKKRERIVELEDEDILPSENTSEHPIKEESLASIVSQEEDVIPVRRSIRTHKAPNRLCLNIEIDPDRLCFNVEVEEHSLGDLNEPANYKAALSDPEFEKWLVAINAEMKSMYDNKVGRLVVLPPNAKVVKSKWIYKKKTAMDGKVHIYKARLVTKGCTQTYGVDYEETFSPIADIRAIRILIAIAAFYDYEIWQMDVKTAFLNGFLEEEIYMEQPEGFIDPNHPRKVYLGEAAFILGIKIYRDRSRRLIGLSQNAYLDKILKRYRMDNSKRGSILMQVDLYLSKSQCATTSAEMKCMQNVPYALAVGSIMYAVRRIWKSSKQSTTAQHATEAEYIAASEAAKEAIWIRKFIDELGVVPSNDYPLKMNYDNSTAIIMAKESGIQKGVRHFKRKYHYVRECIETGKIDIVKVHTDDNLADPFTKALAGPKLTGHARSMGLHPASSFM
ncbi:retrotransposon protein, putative, ty1-copia subclass [Tanacetum coccineum]